MKKIWYVLIFVFICCKPRIGDTHSQAKGVVVNSRQLLWQSTNLSLCWEPYNEKISKITVEAEQILKAEFNQKTIVKFSGFRTCEDQIPADIHVQFQLLPATQPDDVPLIYLNQEHPPNWGGRVLDFGNQIKNIPNGVQVKIFERNLYQMNNDEKLTLLHEMGHVLGLRHEHAHKDAKGDCQYIGTELLTLDIGAYDPESVMNYCNIEKIHKDPNMIVQLSKGDAELVNRLYEKKIDIPDNDYPTKCIELGGTWQFVSQRQEGACCYSKNRSLSIPMCELTEKDAHSSCEDHKGHWSAFIKKCCHSNPNILLNLKFCRAFELKQIKECQSQAAVFEYERFCCHISRQKFPDGSYATCEEVEEGP